METIISVYEAFLKTIDDRHLNDLWLKYCAPSETGKINPDKACMIYNEMIGRDLL